MLTILSILGLLAIIALPVALLITAPKTGLAFIALIVLSAIVIVGLAWLGSLTGAGSALCAAALGVLLTSIAWGWFLTHIKRPE